MSESFAAPGHPPQTVQPCVKGGCYQSECVLPEQSGQKPSFCQWNTTMGCNRAVGVCGRKLNGGCFTVETPPFLECLSNPQKFGMTGPPPAQEQ